MWFGSRIALPVAAIAALLIAANAAGAADEHHAAAPHPAAVKVEPHPSPRGYQRVTAPQGWDQRPKTVDRPAYQHVYQAAHNFKIGPYHPPRGYVARRWVYGQILPRAYWAAPYQIADYWLFALEVPPVGYEWVRVGNDAVLVNIGTGEILQVEYGVFA
jgi:Ni/Co efflux regulator RcnB